MGLGIFVTAVILVSFICLCFFKKRFWENRYLVLLISGGVALVATLTTNYVTRSGLGTKIETIWQKPIYSFYVENALLVDSSIAMVMDEEWGFKSDFVGSTEDSIEVEGIRIDSTVTDSGFVYIDSTEVIIMKRLTTLFFYNTDNIFKVGYWDGEDKEKKVFDYVYIQPSEHDTISYLAKKRLYYDTKPNRWIAGFSLPHIKTIKCFYIPPTEYAMIPDSLIREMPF